MSNASKLQTMTALLGIIFLLASCERPTNYTPGNYIHDPAITSAVIEAFNQDPLLHTLPIRVDTKWGVVTLTGTTINQTNEEKAVEVARQVRGVKSVEDHIVVQH